ncbi:ABC transporter substrate-binding protein [Nonomuraea sp. SYSU D8015]|uniref:ABC transporter substrate-binding protein n=1 Tax=Nonomuraea sp. SYSU D8015 TaxID=2593644 RepID=UPI001CB703B0|nr:ABC transporter substrate-binding protein [Nonomuraea sp. SYSU D8015]
MSLPRRIACIAVVASAALATAACGSHSSPTAAGSEPSATAGTQLYFVDGNTADYSGDFEPGTLNGVRATLPGGKIGEEFRQRILEINSKVKDFTYAPEAYDATILSALAAVAAKNDSGKAIAEKEIGITRDGTKCTSFKQCADLLADGADIDYDGASGPIEMNSTGSPSAATVGIYQFGQDNNYTNVGYVNGTTPDQANIRADQKVSGPIPKGDGTLTFGTLLPATGDSSFLGAPQFAGVDLAIDEINKAGGVLGKDVKQLKGDSGDGSPNIAPSETDKLLRGGADVIIGAASSSVSMSVIDKITGAGVVQISAGNTSTAFDTYPDHGMYFRTAPSDVLQGQVMAQTISEDGHRNIAILARQDAYGEALAKNVRSFYEESGGKVVSYVLYDANAANYTAEVEKVKAQHPDAIVLISFDESKKIVPELIKAGIGQNG